MNKSANVSFLNRVKNRFQFFNVVTDLGSKGRVFAAWQKKENTKVRVEQKIETVADGICGVAVGW
jgi:hypothetical protein